MDSLHGINPQGLGVADVLAPLGIVWIWIVVLFAVAVWRFRRNRYNMQHECAAERAGGVDIDENRFEAIAPDVDRG